MVPESAACLGRSHSALSLLAFFLVAGLRGPAATLPQSFDAFPAAAFVRGSATAPTSAQAFAATIDRHYNALHTLSVHFTQQYDGLGMHRTESGTLLLERPGRLASATSPIAGPSAGRMRWTYTKPAGKLFILDGRDAYFYTPGQAEVPRVPAKKLDDMRSPLAFLLGHAALAKELQGLALAPAADGNAGQWTLSGVPRGMEKRVASLTITASADGTIVAMRVEETDGAVNGFRLAEEQANVALPPGAFTFTPPPGTHVVDGMPPL